MMEKEALVPEYLGGFQWASTAIRDLNLKYYIEYMVNE